MSAPPPVIYPRESCMGKFLKLVGAFVLLIIALSFLAALFTEQSKPKAPSTSTQTLVPSSEPTRQGLYVKTWKWAYTDYGSPYIEGVVINDSDRTYSFVSVEFAIYNDRDERIGTASDSINNLKPGDRWRFKASPLISDEEGTIYARFEELSGW